MLGTQLGSRPDRRAAPRYDITVPIDLDPGRKGITRNVSSSGVLFELEGPGGMGAGDAVRFRLGLRSVAGRLCCEGRVVWLQPANGRCVVATTIETCWFG